MNVNYSTRASLFVVLAIAAVLAAAMAFWLPAEPLTPDPNLRLTLMDGRKLMLHELRGRPVLISFWSTSCPPCVEEAPDLIRLYEELRPRGFELIAVAMPYDAPLQVQSFIRQHHISYPIAIDTGGEALRAFDDVKFIPTAFLLNPDGQVIYRHTGKVDTERLKRLVEPLFPPGASRDSGPDAPQTFI